MTDEFKKHKIPRQKRYLVFAGLSFMFSLFGFAGTLEPFTLSRARGIYLVEDPVAQGLTLMGVGLVFLYFYFNPRSR